ncbi:hypothetical protein ARMSODRAFT_976192 [Armillaria solidipes]|uniref:Uncharacterized protein n=1 Tax=Armillaria solidipes TaxID=1076256 RepID=A0A2H3BZB9_9AGAR|nr:hypothetical protein ARMSODRAFT_976192 [Armillaria solidipes]
MPDISSGEPTFSDEPNGRAGVEVVDDDGQGGVLATGGFPCLLIPARRENQGRKIITRWVKSLTKRRVHCVQGAAKVLLGMKTAGRCRIWWWREHGLPLPTSLLDAVDDNVVPEMLVFHVAIQNDVWSRMTIGSKSVGIEETRRDGHGLSKSISLDHQLPGSSRKNSARLCNELPMLHSMLEARTTSFVIGELQRQHQDGMSIFETAFWEFSGKAVQKIQEFRHSTGKTNKLRCGTDRALWITCVNYFDSHAYISSFDLNMMSESLRRQTISLDSSTAPFGPIVATWIKYQPKESDCESLEMYEKDHGSRLGRGAYTLGARTSAGVRHVTAHPLGFLDNTVRIARRDSNEAHISKRRLTIPTEVCLNTDASDYALFSEQRAHAIRRRTSDAGKLFVHILSPSCGDPVLAELLALISFFESNNSCLNNFQIPQTKQDSDMPRPAMAHRFMGNMNDAFGVG